MAYREINSSGDAWDFEENPTVEGEYLSKKENVGENESTMYYLKTADGQVAIWGSTVLDMKMALVKQGDRVKISFLGSKPSPKRPGKTYKDFQVEVWED